MIKIDTHHHFWNLAKVDYPWLTPAAGALYRTYEPSELAPQLNAAGIDRTVLVQSANNTEDTISMLTQAEDYDWIAAVTGWVPLLDPDKTARLLERYSRHPKFRGMRHLIHNEPDPDWIVQDRVIEGLKVLAGFNVIFELVAVHPLHLKHTPTLVERVPDLTIVIDHLAVPPIRNRANGRLGRANGRGGQLPQRVRQSVGVGHGRRPRGVDGCRLEAVCRFRGRKFRRRSVDVWQRLAGMHSGSKLRPVVARHQRDTAPIPTISGRCHPGRHGAEGISDQAVRYPFTR